MVRLPRRSAQACPTCALFGRDWVQVAAAGVDAEEDEESPDLADDEAESPPEPEDFLSPPRKSVTYQPEPLSWKPAAVTCFT